MHISAFDLLDQNHDGLLTRAEFEGRAPGEDPAWERDAPDRPGIYVIIQNGTRVSASQKTGGKQVGTLPFSSTVEVLEIVDVGNRKRGRIQNPAGWFSILDLQNGHRWARCCR